MPYQHGCLKTPLLEAALFERQCKNEPLKVDKAITLAAYTELWLQEIAPAKLAKSTLARDKQDIDRFMPYLGGYKLTDLKAEHFRNLYAELRKQKNSVTGKPLSECTVEGVHACLCGILSDAMEGGFLSHNPAWRTYKYAGKNWTFTPTHSTIRRKPPAPFCKRAWTFDYNFDCYTELEE